MAEDAAIHDLTPAVADPARRGAIPAYAWAILAVAFVVLIVHAARYWFLTDDAYISFRYALNLANGHGLVFNPGFERVEGYTNFLWVLMLAGLAVLGLAPESMANVLSITAGVLLWAIVARFAIRERRADRSILFALVAPVLLAFTRSYAVWCTSGLETKLFELFVVFATLRAVTELRRWRQGRRAWPLSALFFALGTLTRPDGLLIAFCVLALQTLLLWRSGAFRYSRTALALVVYVAIVGAHVLWRRAYYGDWLPNTFYAKTGGGAWWNLGVRYVALWLVEYAAVLWVPLLLAAVIDRFRSVRGDAPLLFAAAIVPHVVYLMSIGGDHFEYRPLDVYFPLIYLLLGDGAAAIAASAARARLAVAYVCVVWIGTVVLPEATHHAYPARYIVGFPGDHGRTPDDDDFITSETNPLLTRVPLVRSYVRLFNELVRVNTKHFAAIRQEEHRLFLETVIPEGRLLSRYVREGRLPADLHIAIDSIGAIPYYSNLRTLDRLGLADRRVARQGVRMTGERRLVAHEVYATLEYAAEIGVDLWSIHAVNLLQDVTNIDIFEAVVLGASKLPEFACRVDDDHFIVATFPDRGQPTPRVNELDWKPLQALIHDRDYVQRIADHLDDLLGTERNDARLFRLHGIACMQLGDVRAAERSFHAAIDIEPNESDGYFNLGSLHEMAAQPERAIPLFRRAIEIGPPTAQAYNALGRAYVQYGRADDAIAAFREAIRLNADDADAHGNLANVLATAGHVEEAMHHYDTAIRLAPVVPLNYQNLSIVRERAGDEAGAAKALRRGVENCSNAPGLLARLAFLLATSPDDAVRDGPAARELAEQAVTRTHRQDAHALEALAAALAATGNFDEASRIADEALRITTVIGNAALQQRLEQERSHYATKTPFRRERTPR